MNSFNIREVQQDRCQSLKHSIEENDELLVSDRKRARVESSVQRGILKSPTGHERIISFEHKNIEPVASRVDQFCIAEHQLHLAEALNGTTSPDGEKENFCHLREPYSLTESHKVILANGQSARLYPTAKVMEIFNDFQKQHNSSRVTAETNPVKFKDFFREHNQRHSVTIEEDTTLYIKKEELENQITTTIKDNHLIRSGKFEWKYNKEYMFIINQEGNLLVQSKKRENRHGRIHHSSLSQGNPVRAAGVVKLINDRTIVFKNLSGHYQPRPETLDEVLKWFEDQKAQIHETNDTQIYSKEWKMMCRELTITLSEVNPAL